MCRGSHGPHQVVSQELRWVRQARSDVCPVSKRGEDLEATYRCEVASSSSSPWDLGNDKKYQDFQAFGQRHGDCAWPGQGEDWCAQSTWCLTKYDPKKLTFFTTLVTFFAKFWGYSWGLAGVFGLNVQKMSKSAMREMRILRGLIFTVFHQNWNFMGLCRTNY